MQCIYIYIYTSKRKETYQFEEPGPEACHGLPIWGTRTRNMSCAINLRNLVQKHVMWHLMRIKFASNANRIRLSRSHVIIVLMSIEFESTKSLWEQEKLRLVIYVWRQHGKPVNFTMKNMIKDVVDLLDAFSTVRVSFDDNYNTAKYIRILER
jgi:hypothetical protein